MCPHPISAYCANELRNRLGAQYELHAAAPDDVLTTQLEYGRESTVEEIARLEAQITTLGRAHDNSGEAQRRITAALAMGARPEVDAPEQFWRLMERLDAERQHFRLLLYLVWLARARTTT